MGRHTRKPRLTLAQARLIAELWPHAHRYCRAHAASEIVADIFDGWKNEEDMRPLVKGRFVYKVHNFDRNDFPQHYNSWNLTPLGERAVFGRVISLSLSPTPRDSDR